MTTLLDAAIERLRCLPEPQQDSVARAIILQLEEEAELSDFERHQPPLPADGI